jgi:hypothetical protein
MALARICAKFGLQHNCPGRALVSLLSGEAALFQTGGLGGLTIVRREMAPGGSDEKTTRCMAGRPQRQPVFASLASPQRLRSELACSKSVARWIQVFANSSKRALAKDDGGASLANSRHSFLPKHGWLPMAKARELAWIV